MKNLTWQNPEQLFVAQELINKVKSKCCGIKDYNELTKDHSLEVIDFVDSTEEDDTRSLWNSQIDVLKRVFGI